ncbi:hypothetical protein SBA2_100045 [Acidobacteriia bacterium SbA2]|nr:hypothetical protein SBA2_100045 [Acidobacteriia bacterium SbA2]
MALPAINRFDGRQDVNAGSKLSFHQPARDLPAFILISCGDEDYDFIRHISSRAAGMAAKFRGYPARAAIARPAVFARESAARAGSDQDLGMTRLLEASAQDTIARAGSAMPIRLRQ